MPPVSAQQDAVLREAAGSLIAIHDAWVLGEPPALGALLAIAEQIDPDRTTAAPARPRPAGSAHAPDQLALVDTTSGGAQEVLLRLAKHLDATDEIFTAFINRPEPNGANAT